MMPWLRDNATALAVLISLCGGVWYLATTLASKADVATVATKADVERVSETVGTLAGTVGTLEETVRALRNTVTTLDSTVDRADGTIGRLTDSIERANEMIPVLNETVNRANETLPLLVSCVIDLHPRTVDIGSLIENFDSIGRWRADPENVPFPLPPPLPESCEQARSRARRP